MTAAHRQSSFESSCSSAVGTGSRILLVDNHAGCFFRYRLPLAHKLREAGFDVHVALPSHPSADEMSRLGIPVHVFYLRRTSTALVNELRCLASLLMLYRRLRPSLVHHFCLKPALYGGIAARIAGVPALMSTLTGLGYPYTVDTARMRILRPFIELGLWVSFRHPNRRVIFQNPEDRDRLLGHGMPADCAVLIRGSGVDLSLFTPQPEPDGTPVVLLASRLLWQKGVGEFVAASRSLRARGVKARFVLVGEPDRGHPSAVPVKILHEWCQAGDVEWLGWRNDVAALIAQSHVVCLPSSYGEGVPRILLEAASSGRPIVATDIPGSRDIVRHGDNGLLVPPGDGEALAGAIARLLESAPLRTAMGARGHTIATMEFHQRRVIEENLTLYGSLLGAVVGTADPSRVRF